VNSGKTPGLFRLPSSSSHFIILVASSRCRYGANRFLPGIGLFVLATFIGTGHGIRTTRAKRNLARFKRSPAARVSATPTNEDCAWGSPQDVGSHVTSLPEAVTRRQYGVVRAGAATFRHPEN
jgi:hypothetical protein